MFNAHAQISRAAAVRLLLAAGLSFSAINLAWAECDATIRLGAVTPYVLQGDPAPGTGLNFESFGRPSLARTGSVAFTGDLTGSATVDGIVWRDDAVVAREGFPAPSTEGTYLAFELFECARQINSRGNVVYITTLGGGVPTTANRAVYRDDTLIAREGDPAPSIPDRLFVDFGFVSVTDDGTVGMLTDLDGSTANDSVIYFGDTVLYRQGDMLPPLPAIPAGTIWDSEFVELQWNGGGDLVFVGNTNLVAGDQVLVRHSAGKTATVEIVLRETQEITQADPPGLLELYLQSAIAENGDWGMRGNLNGPTAAADAFILTESGFYMQEGAAVPELPGVVLGNFNGVAINSLGDVVYLADLIGAADPNVDEGLFVNGCLITTDGVQAPGLPEGTLLTDIMFERISINDDRLILFQTSYTGGDGIFQLSLEKAGGEPADLDGDGDVDGFDLALLLGQWTGAAMYAPCPPIAAADLNGDCRIDGFDLALLLGAWG